MVLIGLLGVGKFMLLWLINYLECVDSGYVIVGGQLIGYCCDGDILYELFECEICCWCVEVGMVFQGFNLFLYLIVLENIIEVLIVVCGVLCVQVE